MINVIIYPTSYDVGKVNGLCGIFDGAMANDLTHAGGTTTTVAVDAQGVQSAEPLAFAQSYK